MAFRVGFITQDDPFYLAESFRYVLDHLPTGAEVGFAVVLGASPFGKRLSFLSKIRQTYDVFGTRFLWHYGWRFLQAKLSARHSVKEVLRARSVEILTPSGPINAPEFLEELRARRPDLLVSFAGNQIFKQPLIELAPKGCLNVHSALLPRHRGLMPTFWALKHGDSETGVSVFFVDEGIDTGPILVQKRVPIRARSLDALLWETKQVAAAAVVESITKIQHGGYALMPNTADEGNYNTFPKRDDVREFVRAGNRLF